MSFIKNLFGKKDASASSAPLSYSDFWAWFRKHERDFHKVVKEQGDIEKHFFDLLTPKLAELKDGYYFLTGMIDDNTVELVLTADGNTKNIVFIEELVNAAPSLKGWLFTALKPALDIENVCISMAGYNFDKETLNFYVTIEPDFPDEIDITIIHRDYTEENKSDITNGCFIFLDNYLGELNFVTTIDTVTVSGKDTDPTKEIIPIEKLKDYLVWREKEFIEKYEGINRVEEKANYSILRGEMQHGDPLIAVVNTDLLNWDSKASHPWILTLELNYKGEKNRGMPDEGMMALLDEIEDLATKNLKDEDGYLNIGRQTANNVREIYFVCKDFRKPSKIAHLIQQTYASQLDMDYDLYKDKYWRSFQRFMPH